MFTRRTFPSNYCIISTRCYPIRRFTYVGERKGSAKQRFHYSRADEKFLRQRVFWNGRWCLEHGSDQNLLNAFIGTEDEGNLCDPTRKF